MSNEMSISERLVLNEMRINERLAPNKMSNSGLLASQDNSNFPILFSSAKFSARKEVRKPRYQDFDNEIAPNDD